MTAEPRAHDPAAPPPRTPSLALLRVDGERWVAATSLGDGQWAQVDGAFPSESQALAAAMGAIRAALARRS